MLAQAKDKNLMENTEELCSQLFPSKLTAAETYLKKNITRFYTFQKHFPRITLR